MGGSRSNFASGTCSPRNISSAWCWAVRRSSGGASPHKIADAIYERLTGEMGYFDTRIIYVAETGAITEPIKRLAIMDQDGANLRYLTNGDNLVLTPRYSPSAQEITYLLYLRGQPRVYLYNVDTGQQEVLGNFPGMTFAPRFSPDGNKVVMTYAQDGNSEIYEMDLRTREIERLTNNPAIDTAPTYSPDAEYVTFGIRPGRHPADLRHAQRRARCPAHQLRQRAIRHPGLVATRRPDRVYEEQQGDVLYRRDGSRRLGREVAGGRFPRRRTELVAERPGAGFYPPQRNVGDGHHNELVSIDLTGYNQRVLVTPTGASDPAWSPVIP